VATSRTTPAAPSRPGHRGDVRANAAPAEIKACWIICTNPVASVANRDSVIEGLQAAELVIAQDAFLDTETNRYADILLPGALWAEAEGVMINSERNLTLMQQAVEPPGDALADWQIIACVARAKWASSRVSPYASAAEVFDEIKRAGTRKPATTFAASRMQRLRERRCNGPVRRIMPSDRNPIRYLNDGVSQTL
jgi:sulfite reductase (NADPH) flavoprotein alpha-component